MILFDSTHIKFIFVALYERKILLSIVFYKNNYYILSRSRLKYNYFCCQTKQCIVYGALYKSHIIKSFIRKWILIMFKKGLIFICHCLVLAGSQVVYANDYDAQFNKIKIEYQSKSYQDVISDGEMLLRKYPSNPDVGYYTGLAYYQLKKYSQAVKILTPILSEHPNYTDVRLALINTLFAQKKYGVASGVIKDGLKLQPRNIDLKMQQAKLFVIEKKYTLARKELEAILVIRKDYQPAIDLQQKIKNLKNPGKKNIKALKAPSEKKRASSAFGKNLKSYKPLKPQYVFGAATSIMDVTLPREYWNYSTMSLYRNQENISYGVELNYANRFDERAVQGGLAIIPQLGETAWVNLAYYYADEPQIFPDHTVYGEIYKNTGNFVFSIGDSYKKINKTYFNTYTGSITSYIKNMSFGFRPLYYQTKSGPNSLLYRFNIRFYADNPDQYFGLIFATGTSPDLFDLLTVNFFRVREKIIMAESQFVINQALLLQLGGGYEEQRFLNQTRELTYLNLGLKYRFGYV